jgi:hypothetical protein
MADFNAKPMSTTRPVRDGIVKLALEQVLPAPENELLYRPVTTASVADLVPSVRTNGILEPLVVSRDGFLISGHRRLVAAKAAGLTEVPCRIEEVSRRAEPDRFICLLREANRQRVKSFDEAMREEAVSMNRGTAYASLIEARDPRRLRVQGLVKLRAVKERNQLTEAKRPLLNAVQRVLNEMADWLPLTVRTIHYNLLNKPPLLHASKPESIYRNDLTSYRAAVDVCMRARLEGLIPWESIADETRPVNLWDTYRNAQDYVRAEMKSLLDGYWRDLMQSQPDHIEIMVEKNTALSAVREVAMKYCIPVTSGRGFASAAPRHAMAQRYLASGKNRLVALCLSDFDPDGEEITHSFARTLRDDFGVKRIVPVKVSLTAAQVSSMRLPHAPDMKAKPSSPNYRRFVDQYGEDVYELESLQPDQLAAILTRAVDSVIDRDLFNRELEAEKDDALNIQAQRAVIRRFVLESGGQP